MKIMRDGELFRRSYSCTNAPQEETDLSFADFDVPKRPYTDQAFDGDPTDENAPAASGRGHSEKMEHETGFEPATLTLAT